MTERPCVFAISDLHLPGGDQKPMDIFGDHWQDHFQQIKTDWIEHVTDQDIVLLPGDISWAMHLKDALPDLQRIGELPGRKIMLKGNHDYWWSAISQVRNSLPEGFYALQNDAVALGEMVFAGSRGWTTPGGDKEEPDTQKIYQRELLRLEMSLQQAAKVRNGRPLIALCHFPPCSNRGEDTPVTRLLERYEVNQVVYGHLHGTACGTGFQGEKNGVRYHLTSCDCLGFQLLKLPI